MMSYKNIREDMFYDMNFSLSSNTKKEKRADDNLYGCPICHCVWEKTHKNTEDIMYGKNLPLFGKPKRICPNCRKEKKAQL